MNTMKKGYKHNYDLTAEEQKAIIDAIKDAITNDITSLDCDPYHTLTFCDQINCGIKCDNLQGGTEISLAIYPEDGFIDINRNGNNLTLRDDVYEYAKSLLAPFVKMAINLYDEMVEGLLDIPPMIDCNTDEDIVWEDEEF